MDKQTLTRRAACAGLVAAPTVAMAARGPIVAMLGDSITAGYGLPATQALPTQLHAALKALGQDSVVQAAGISGDTAAGGAARVDRAVAAGAEVCVVALGGNDLLLGVDPEKTRASLEAILRHLERRRITPVLAGLTAPPFLGDYARRFNATFPALARAHRTRFYPNLLRGVMGVQALNQPDGVHPNARGVQVIARGLAPVVAHALRARTAA